MRVIVKKWGNSASVRIPAAIMEATHLSLNEEVDIREESGHIVIEPIRSYNLLSLIDGISNENLHSEVNFGTPVGKASL